MRRLVRICAGRPVSVIMALAAILLAGISAALRLPLDRLPEIAVPRVMVEAGMPGLPALDIRSLIAVPLEDALASAKGLVRSSSLSTDGHTVLTLDFDWGEDPAEAASRVREIVDAACLSLPEEAAKPLVLVCDPDAGPLMTLTISPKRGDLNFARQFAEREAKARLRRVEGAGHVLVAGGFKHEVAVAVDMRKAAARGLTVYDVARTVASENADAPAGAIREGSIESVAVARGRAESVRVLAGMVATGSSGPFRLSDLADVFERNAPRKSLVVANGEERVALELYKRAGADPVETARAARAVIRAMAEEFESDMNFEIVEDSSLQIAASIRKLAVAGAAGAVVAAAVLFALLGNFTAGMMVASAIPVSVAATLAALNVMGRSLNGMSLGGIALAIGMVSDNAVVVLVSLDAGCSNNYQRPDTETVAKAVGSVIGGTFGSMMTTAVVFIPVIFLPGALGMLFGDLALAIVVANVSGWLTAVLAIPALYRLFWMPVRANSRTVLERTYRRALAFALTRPGAVLGIAASLACAGIAIVVTRPFSFMPEGNASQVEVRAVFPAGTDTDHISSRAIALTAQLSKVPGIRGAFGRSGIEDDDYARRADRSNADECLVVACPLIPRADADEIQKLLLEAAEAALPGVAVSASAPDEPALRLLGFSGGTMLAVRGDTRNAVMNRLAAAESAIGSEAGEALQAIERSPAGLINRVLVTPRRPEMASLGVSIADAALAFRTATDGATVSAIGDGGADIPIVVFATDAGSASGTGSMSELMKIPVSADSGRAIQASAVARCTFTTEPTAVARLDRSDVMYLRAVPAAGRERVFQQALDRVIDRLPWVARSGESALRRYGKTMAWSVFLVLALLYLTLGAQFESFRLPLQIMCTIPLALAGVGPALALACLGLDSGSILGLVVLFGTVVNNAILLYEAGSARRAQGAGRIASAYAGASDRIRPVLATTMTTIVAVLPLCFFSMDAGQKSMSITMLGGLVASTALTLFVSPVVFAGKGFARSGSSRGEPCMRVRA